jgi:hypothetical protein
MLLVAMLAVVTANQVQHMEVDPVKLRKMADDVGVVRPAAALQSSRERSAPPPSLARVGSAWWWAHTRPRGSAGAND